MIARTLNRNAPAPMLRLRTTAFQPETRDRFIKTIVKTAQNPFDTTLGWPAVAATQALALLAPETAAAQLLAEAVEVNLSGVTQIHLPYIPPAGRPTPIFVGEGMPAPAVNLALSSQTLGPARKILVMSAFTNELQSASAATAQRMISEALEYAVQAAVDVALFSANAATAVAPPGLLNGVTPVTAATGSGLGAMADDLGNIAQAIAAAGINAENVVYVASPKLATAIRCMASPKFDNLVLSSAAIPAGEVIGVAPNALYLGYDGSADIQLSREASVHFEDTTPAPIVGTGGVPAVPTKTAFQTDLTVIKVRAKCAWAVQPGGVSWVQNVVW